MRAGGVPALAAALALVVPLADAAPKRAASAGARERGPDLFAGYSYTHAGEAGLNGWSLGGSHPFRGEWSFVADLSGHYGSFAGANLAQLAFMGGVRWRTRAGRRLSPFAEGLLGAARTSTSVEVSGTSIEDADTDWGLGVGGGLDYHVGERWSVRGLFHLRVLWGEGATDEDPRVSVGAAYRFGR